MGKLLSFPSRFEVSARSFHFFFFKFVFSFQFFAVDWTGLGFFTFTVPYSHPHLPGVDSVWE